LVRQDPVIDVTAVLDRLPSFRYPLPKFDPFIAKLYGLRDYIEGLADDQLGIPIAEVKFASPVANPGKIIAAPVNYQRHLARIMQRFELRAACGAVFG